MTENSNTPAGTRPETAILVGGGDATVGDDGACPMLDELADLARTAGVRPVARYYQRRTTVDSTFYLGKGKVDEIGAGVREHEADVVLFDNELSPRQVRNLEERLGCKVLDRSELILDIFAHHARTQQAKLQVELAQLRYVRPRLRRMWTHLSRITGQGGVGSRGPGEKQIETDRRIIDRRILGLERELDEIQARRERQVSTRHDELTVGLVGYTNAGKSTLMNRLTGAAVYTADQLFATLDTKTSDFMLPNGRRVFLSDTVGFIENLPHHLIASFNATLEEVRQAKLLLHVVDASHVDLERQIETVNKVLDVELGLRERKELMVFNKMDRAADPVRLSAIRTRYREHFEVSALTGEGIDALIKAITVIDDADRETLELAIPAADGKTLAEVQRAGQIFSTLYEGDTAIVRVNLPKRYARTFDAFKRGN